MSQIEAEASPRAVIEEYVEACRVGSSDRLQAIFHPDALMSGYYKGEFYMGTPQPFFDEVEASQGQAEASANYSAEITTVETSGACASLTLKELGFLGSDFTNWFHLSKVDARWVILSKTYIDE